ncbi:uncharacterized protein K452DRAFT_320297 [Aplosporella prunicola CBS 121167]|uniref:Myotubularin phosphatase domain-containing protein n=1 Tax=Aplosporella prunicola CBS 121167 TaxID=1176127 RepID=A0A6A6B9S4_9PEZI|nr:uncharacterized protein K452DRAFT_320297 [Aplosporella prunicola CBS 121167]KAF2139667.1 hypothetical protein K452DRAFT_320297 [Aplosporella prunicola CBS 121167]
MDSRIRVSRVEDVKLYRTGRSVDGTLHLQLHHLVFKYHDTPQPTDKPARPREMWIAYPMISRCNYRPAPPVSHTPPEIRIQCRDFTFISLHFRRENEGRDVYDTIRCLTCKLGSIENLYAFTYRSPEPERAVSGWQLYDPRREFKRMGISAKDPDKGWRLSDINHDYQYCATYPAVMAVPSVISDMTLKYARDFRSRHRIPALVYLHPINNCSITRSSQPLPGIQRKRNPQDEKLIAAIFATSKPNGEIDITDSNQPSPSDTPVPSTTPNRSSDNLPATSGDSSFVVEGMATEDQIVERAASSPDQAEQRKYGAQQVNLIVDARPFINSAANSVIGKGSEDMAHYRNATKVFLGIANIHVMRKSLQRVVDALKNTDTTPLPPVQRELINSGWLSHINGILDGARTIAYHIAVNHSHVLIHCSDGWDRTSQLSALAQICLDPYYRTLEGYMVLIEKDWLSFGHQFRLRSGHLNSERWFEVENERIGGNDPNAPPGGSNAFENALLSAKGFFGNRKTESRESLVDSDNEVKSDSPAGSSRTNTTRHTVEKAHTTKTDEVSPVFHQFLDATYQLLQQNPTRFEFNERFLRRLLYHLYSCQYGTFLFDNEKERVESKAYERTQSVWDFFIARKKMFMNEKYDATVDDRIQGKERILFPKVKPGSVRWWAEAFGRKDEEMNVPGTGASVSYSQREPGAPALNGIETANPNTGSVTARQFKPNESSMSGDHNLTVGFASMSTGRRSPSPSRPQDPHAMQEMMEVEMQ